MSAVLGNAWPEMTVFSDSYDFLDMSRCDSESIQISMIYTVCIASNWSMTGQTVNTDISIRSFPDE